MKTTNLDDKASRAERLKTGRAVATGRFMTHKWSEEVEKKVIASLKMKCPPPAVMADIINLGHKPLLDALAHHVERCDGTCPRAYDAILRARKGRNLARFEADEHEQAMNYRLNPEVLKMVLKQTKDLRLIKHTGEVANAMPMQQHVDAQTKQGTTVVVKKDMPSYDLSLHVAMSGSFNTAQGEARFCAMKTDVAKYISGMKLSLSGEGEHVHKETDMEGCAHFEGMKKGKYEIWSGEDLIADIEIK